MTSRTFHAGKTLKELIEKSGRDTKLFADRVNKARQTIYNWFKEPVFTKELYDLIAPVLREWQIDPSPINPAGGVRITDPDELRGVLRGIPVDCLMNVKILMSAAPETKVAILALIDEKLEREEGKS